jgi:catechol 2,3-dioxygenase-like lactoylglutathione lyase family enzyme
MVTTMEKLSQPQRQSGLRLNGVHHSARPTWKLRDTVAFYRDVLELPLIHCVSARGWGPADHPDFLHFFFDSGAGSSIAFFYYMGHGQPDHLIHRPKFDSDAIHTAWRVESQDALLAWRARLEQNGVNVLFQVEHEVVESFYFRDPNGYLLEIGRPLRPFTQLDAVDAGLTLRAAIEEEDRQRSRGEDFSEIEAVWRAKGTMIALALQGYA